MKLSYLSPFLGGKFGLAPSCGVIADANSTSLSDTTKFLSGTGGPDVKLSSVSTLAWGAIPST